MAAKDQQADGYQKVCHINLEVKLLRGMNSGAVASGDNKHETAVLPVAPS